MSGTGSSGPPARASAGTSVASAVIDCARGQQAAERLAQAFELRQVATPEQIAIERHDRQGLWQIVLSNVHNEQERVVLVEMFVYDLPPRAIVAGMLVSASNKEILARMLRNLKAIYLERKDYAHALSIIDCMLALSPGAAGEVRDRGLTYLGLECFRAALADLECYLQMAPGAADLDEVRAHVVGLRRSTARLN